MSANVKTIAVCAAQVPFFTGGAEALATSLVNQLRLRGFEVDLINIPYKWYPRSQLHKSIRIWQQLDLTESNGKEIDLVIATKFPSYFIQHPRKTLWLVHQYRQMYDLMDDPTMRGFHPAWPPDILARRKLIAMDTKALASYPNRYTIAQNTTDRLANFNGLSAETLYHPPPLHGRYRNEQYLPYVLSVGRLDELKRVDTLLRAMPHVNKNIRCKIAGTGPARAGLEAIIAELDLADRVDLLGYVDDDSLIDLYANASAVYFAPKDEDYGYVTLEALLSGKPVITAPDAGGPLEFVRHRETGMVVDCQDAAALGETISSLLSDSGLCRELGQNGKHSVAGLSWDNVIQKLTGADHA